MKINGITSFLYFHHYFEPKTTPGLHVYAICVGIRKLSLGIDWTPYDGSRRGRGYHIWISIPFVSLMLEYRCKDGS